MTSHITLECDFQFSASNGYTCSARNLNVISANVTIVRVAGEHLPNMKNDDVKNFIVARQNLKYIPEGIAMFFRNLETFTVFKSNLESLRFTDFMGFYRLRQIFIQANNLQRIDEDVLKVVPRLELLDLTGNNIGAIPFSMFSLANYLRFVTLSNNLIRVFDIVPFPVDAHLEELRLNSNQLQRINLAFMANVRRLRMIDLHGNRCINRSFPGDARSMTALMTEIVGFCNRQGYESGWI